MEYVISVVGILSYKGGLIRKYVDVCVCVCYRQGIPFRVLFDGGETLGIVFVRKCARRNTQGDT